MHSRPGSDIDGRRSATSQPHHGREHFDLADRYSRRLRESSELIQGSQLIFFDAYRGFNVKRLQAQATYPLEIAMAVNSGGWFLLNAPSVHLQSFKEPVESMFLQPHMLEVTKEMAAKQPGSWANLFFAYRKPVIGSLRTAVARGRPARWNGWRVI